MNHSNKTNLAIIMSAILAALYSGAVCSGQNQSSSIDEVRSKITPSHEIWLEYNKLKETPSPATRRVNNTAARRTNQMPQSSNVGGVHNKITPSHEIWLKYEQLKYDMSPAGIEEWKRKEAEKEAEKKAAAERVKQKQEEAARKAAAEKAERERKEKEAQDAAKKAEQQRREAEAISAAAKAEQEQMAAEREQQRKEAEEREKNRPIDLQAAVQRSGLRRTSSFAYYGNVKLRDRLSEAESRRRNVNQFDDDAIARAEAEVNAAEAAIKKAQAEIAQKTFVSEYTYSVHNTKNYGDGSSSFGMSIKTSVNISKNTGEVLVLFPMRNVTGSGAFVGGFITDLYVSVNGSTNSVKELVDNNDHYRARVYFKNLQLNNRGYFETTSATADVQKIEIIKVR